MKLHELFTKVWAMTVRGAGYIAFIISISALVSQPGPGPRIPAFSTAFYRLQTDIRDDVISPDSARHAFVEITRQLRAAFSRDTCAPIDSSHFVYPLRGYYPRESVGGRGRGYRPKGFDLFDMNASGSHPAHDLFIKDGDQDNLDDRTWKPVDVLAFTSGIVVATETGWRYDSAYRGGNWIWIYDPCLDGFFYYAHNNIVQVQPGQWVQAGEKIAEVGRSGYNAYKERSPTHVHLMFLRLDEAGMPEPYNTYEWLKWSRTREVFEAE